MTKYQRLAITARIDQAVAAIWWLLPGARWHDVSTWVFWINFVGYAIIEHRASQDED